MSYKKFKRLQIDGTEEYVIPLTVTDHILLQPRFKTGGIGLLLRSIPAPETGHRTETQWYINYDQAKWLIEELKEIIDELNTQSKHINIH